MATTTTLIVGMLSAPIGTWVEVIHDVSVKRVQYFLDLDLPIPFMSTLDETQKYLLHYPEVTDTIDFYDDVTFIVQYDKGPGVYYHRNDPSAVRMITHKDYSLDVSKVAEYRRDQPAWWMTTRWVSWRSFATVGRIVHWCMSITVSMSLYKLPADRISRAMVGIDSTITEWQAAVLEQSEYTEIMRHQNACLTLQNCTGCVGL